MNEGIQTARLDDSLDALGSETRRRILVALLRVDDPDAWVETGAIPSNGSDPTALVYHHRHLPKLADARYVEWDRERDRVRRGPRFHEVEPVLRLFDDARDAYPHEWP